MDLLKVEQLQFSGSFGDHTSYGTAANGLWHECARHTSDLRVVTEYVTVNARVQACMNDEERTANSQMEDVAMNEYSENTVYPSKAMLSSWLDYIRQQTL